MFLHIKEEEEDDVRACNRSHNEIARIAKRILGNRIAAAAKSTNGKILWYVFDGRWKTVAKFQVKHELSTVVRDHFMTALHKERAYDMQSNLLIMRTKNETAERLANITERLQNTTFKNNVLKEMLEYFYDPDFMKKLDADPNLLGFNNGVWELKNAVFRQGHPEDMVSMSVGFDYNGAVCAESADRVRKYWDTLHPDDNQREYLIHTFARQLYGDSGQELFHIHTGGSDASISNGKTKFFEVMEIVLGDYIRKFGVEMLTRKKRIYPGNPIPQFSTRKGVRIMYCTEPNHDEVLNSGVLKDMTTGGEAITTGVLHSSDIVSFLHPQHNTGVEGITHRLLHSIDIVDFRPQHKIHIMCDAPTMVDCSDAGVQRRIRKLDYISRFVDADEADASKFLFPRDAGLVEAFKADGAMRMEFLRTLLHAFAYAYNFDMPDSLKKTSAMYLNANDAVAMFVEEHVAADRPDTGMELERLLSEETETDLERHLQQETDLVRHLEKRKFERGFQRIHDGHI